MTRNCLRQILVYVFLITTNVVIAEDDTNFESGVVIPSIPEIFHGVWGFNSEMCDDDDLNKLKIYIKPNEVVFNGLIGRVTKVIMIDKNTILVAMTGDGNGMSTEDDIEKFQIFNTGNVLKIGRKGGVAARRCYVTTN